MIYHLLILMDNYLVILMDSVRYDSYGEAKTPNFDKVNATVEKVYSPCCNTTAQLWILLMNDPQYNSIANQFIPFFPSRNTWLPTAFKEKGYHTTFIQTSSTEWSYSNKAMLNTDFDDFIQIYKDPCWYAADEIIDKTIELFKTIEKPKFIVSMFMAAHTPFSDGKNVWMQRSLQGYSRIPQIKAIEAIDKEFGRLLPYLKDTEVIISSDHGELFGETNTVGHNPEGTRWHPVLHEIPLVRGKITNPPPIPPQTEKKERPPIIPVVCNESGIPGMLEEKPKSEVEVL